MMGGGDGEGEIGGSGGSGGGGGGGDRGGGDGAGNTQKVTSLVSERQILLLAGFATHLAYDRPPSLAELV